MNELYGAIGGNYCNSQSLFIFVARSTKYLINRFLLKMLVARLALPETARPLLNSIRSLPLLRIYQRCIRVDTPL